MMAAVIFAAAFAGLAIITDEADAVDAQDTYKVTYVYEGSTVVKTMDDPSAYKFLTFESSSFVAPTGYGFAAWKDVASGAIYKGDDASEYAFTADVTVEPTFSLLETHVAITLKSGDDSKTFVFVKESKIADQADLGDFLKTIGLKNDSGNIKIADELKGSFVFDGFFANAVPEDKETGAVTTVAGLTNPADGKEAVYIASFTPIYDLDFYVDGTITSSIKSNAYTASNQPMNPVKANYTFKGWAVDGEIISIIDAGKIVITEDYIKTLTADTDFVAVFEPVQLTMTLVVGDFMMTQPALYGQAIAAPGLPDGYSHWATMELVDDVEVYTEFDFTQPITEDVVLYAQKAEKVYTVSFISEGVIIGGPYDVTKAYTIPSDPVVEGKKFVGWFVGAYKVTDVKAYVADHAEQDIVLVASFTEADAPAGPGFFQTTTGQCTIVILVVLVLAFIYAVHTNMWGLKDTLASFKLQRVNKKE